MNISYIMKKLRAAGYVPMAKESQLSTKGFPIISVGVQIGRHVVSGVAPVDDRQDDAYVEALLKAAKKYKEDNPIPQDYYRSPEEEQNHLKIKKLSEIKYQKERESEALHVR